jgi:hypothetical protein
VIDDKQFRPGFPGQFRELFGRRMVLRYERLDAFRHLGEQLDRLSFVDENIAAIAGLDRLV